MSEQTIRNVDYLGMRADAKGRYTQREVIQVPETTIPIDVFFQLLSHAGLQLPPEQVARVIQDFSELNGDATQIQLIQQINGIVMHIVLEHADSKKTQADTQFPAIEHTYTHASLVV